MRLLVYSILAILATFNSSLAAAPGVIQTYAAICDPNFPTRCVAPDASGNMPVSGSGGAGLATETTLQSLLTAVQGSIPAGTNIIGKVGIDQTTPGTTNGVVATGDVAAGAADSGNPLKAGGNYSATLPTLDDGDRGNLQLTSRGSLRATLIVNDSSTPLTSSVPADDLTNSQNPLNGNALAYGFDGTTWDRIRSGDVNNVASAAGYFNVLDVGRYNATLPTITDTRYNALQVGSRGSLLVQLMTADAAAALQSSATNADNLATNATTNVLQVNSIGRLYNGATFSRVYEITNGLNSAGTGLQAIGGAAQCDDTAPTAITENQWGAARLDCTSHALMVQGANYSYLRVTADTQIKASAGFIHAVCINPTTATPTAGLMTVYDNTAESGTQIFSTWFFATTNSECAYLDVRAGTGIYVGYDATLANASVTVAYR